MITRQTRIVAVCDWCGGPKNRRRACAADKEVIMPATTAAKAISRARQELGKDGWNLEGNVLCPEHNTAANRKKKFEQPEEGSLASLMRAVRSGT
jgi:hypothetical protein